MISSMDGSSYATRGIPFAYPGILTRRGLWEQ